MTSALNRLLAMPLLVVLMGLGAAAMLVPAAHAAVIENFSDMRAFLYSGLLFLTLTALIAVASSNYDPVHPGRSHLFALFATFLILPVMLAVPFRFAEPDTRFLNAYVEMVSSITTTGATLFEDPDRLSQSVHLWRALVAWMGGFFVLTTAAAILAPMNLGGFDVLASADGQRQRGAGHDDFWLADGGRRILRISVRLFPLYFGLTMFLWLLLAIRTDAPVVTLIHAMSVMSTSGITALSGGIAADGSGFVGEITVFGFFLLALTRQPFSGERRGKMRVRFMSDPELRMGLFFVLAVPAFLFLRHWLGAIEVDEFQNFRAAIRALWGATFTVLSFLSTTGFESAAWDDARNWSGLATPGIVLLGLALIGGGVATTAGGVKLLRVYALYKHGIREMDRLVHPSSVGGSGSDARRFRREGAYLAWIFFMLFALSIALTVLGFAFSGLNLDQAMTLAVAALSTTGPVANVTLAEPVSYAALSDFGKSVLTAAMVLGRLEMLVIISLFNPELWRK